MDRIWPNFVYTLILTISSSGLLTVIFFLQIFNNVTALDRYQNFVSAQYLENEWTEFDKKNYTH